MSENDTENGPIEQTTSTWWPRLVHVFELLVEIEPLGPGVEMLAGVGAAPIVVAAARIDPRVGEILALAQLVENRPGPPMEMRVDDVHGALLPNGLKIR